jgi:hypothetical protein
MKVKRYLTLLLLQLLVAGAALAGPFAASSGSGSTVGGSDTQVQYNNAGVQTGATGVTTDGTKLTATGGLFVPVGSGGSSSIPLVGTGTAAADIGIYRDTGVSETLTVVNGNNSALKNFRAAIITGTTLVASSGLVANGIGVQDNGSGGLWVLSYPGFATFRDLVARHLMTANTVAATVAGSCGTSPSLAGKDSAMTITAGTGSPTSCVVTFGTAWANAPVCTANAQTTTTALNVVTTTTTVTVSAVALTASEKLQVICIGY